jgi:hypothetical protein
LESLAAWLRPSSAERTDLHSQGVTDDRRKLRTALVAWTFLRHDALAFAHEAPHGRPSLSKAPKPGGGRVFVEPHPEAIASLLGTVRQLRFGLTALGVLREDALSSAVAAEVDSILALTLEASARATNDDTSLAELEPELTRIPSRIAALEAWAGSAATPVVIDVHLDATSGKVLEEGTGNLEEIFMHVRDPITRRSVLAVGATIPHWELLESAANRLNDAAWRARIQEGHAPDRDAASEPDRIPAE